MARFVILEHDHPTRHWDLLLESGDHLRAWRLAEAPTRQGQRMTIVPLPNHRLLYLEYEGPLSGERGSVQRWDAGLYQWDQAGTKLRLFDNRRPMLVLFHPDDVAEILAVGDAGDA